MSKFTPKKFYEIDPRSLLVRQDPTQVKHLSGAPLKGRLMALSTNNRLGWNGLLGANTLAYYENSQLTTVNSFITLAPGRIIIKLLRLQFTDVCYKIECLSLAGFYRLVYHLRVRLDPIQVKHL